jgi:transposase InsO family protein
VNEQSLIKQPPTAESETESHRNVGDVPKIPTAHQTSADINAVVTRAQSRRFRTGPDAEVTDNDDPALENNSSPQPLRYRFNRRTVKDGLLVRTAPELDITEISNWSTDYLKQQQHTDPEISLAISWIVAKRRPEWDETKAFSPSLRSLWQQFDSLFIVNEMLYRRFYTNDGIHSHFQFVLPASLKKEFLSLTHADAAGHLKLQKTLEHIQRRAWWYAWKRDAKVFISACRQCAIRHSGKTPRNAGMKALEVGAPCQRWAIDLCGPFRTSDGYKYLFTAIDAYSKYVILQPIRNKEAETVAQAILDRIFYRWGACETLHSDQGSEFNSCLLAEITRQMNVCKTRTTPYRPNCNGQIERMHRTLHDCMAKLVTENQSDWSRLIPYAEFVFNSSIHASTGFSPYFIMTGREAKWQVDLLLPKPEPIKGEAPVGEYMETLLNQQERVHALVRSHIKKAAEINTHWYDLKVKPQQFADGSAVYVYVPKRVKGRTPKWQCYYKTEGTVVKKLNDVTYVVRSKSWRGGPRIVHADKLKLIRKFGPHGVGGNSAEITPTQRDRINSNQN